MIAARCEEEAAKEVELLRAELQAAKNDRAAIERRIRGITAMIQGYTIMFPSLEPLAVEAGIAIGAAIPKPKKRCRVSAEDTPEPKAAEK